VICAAGVAPNTAFLAGSGIAIERGIRVDAGMRTSVKDIYAAGDVTEAAGFHTGSRNSMPSSPMPSTRRASPRTTWPVARRTSGGSLAINVLDTLGLISTSFGQWQGVGKEQGGAGVELVDEANYRYLSLQFKDDMLDRRHQHRLDRPRRRPARPGADPGAAG
jgi:NAD(P)H-nitrite reductase large subunit